MTIDEAIGWLKTLKDTEASVKSGEYNRAVKLGIEALKRLKMHRESHIDITLNLLPGET